MPQLFHQGSTLVLEWGPHTTTEKKSDQGGIWTHDHRIGSPLLHRLSYEARSAIDKFNYLNSLLKGHASRTIQGLSLTEANYESANDIWMTGLEENNR